MRVRHKQPTLVSMWMLDVFCCALGCVILLLLLKMREVQISAEEADQLSSQLTSANESLAEAASRESLLHTEVNERDAQLARLLKEADDAARELALVRDLRRELAKKLALAEEAVKTTEANLTLANEKLDESARRLASAADRSTKTNDDLAARNAENAILAKKLADSQKTQTELQRLLREKESALANAQRQALDLGDRLVLAETRLRNSQKQINDLNARGDEAAKLLKKVEELQKELADANVALVDLQGTKAKLADKVNQLQIEADQRFAGIAMTGRNVVFLVDMSGSMDRTDENTIDPSKWPTVRDTLIKVMRSLPDLSQYQIILFSSKHSYLLGVESQWLPFEREKSIEQVRQAMTTVKPAGDTNLFSAFVEAFKFKNRGLDTIYLLSDGLPTSGPGLSEVEDKTINSETERGIILSRYLRRTLKNVWNPRDGRTRVRINSIGFFYESPDVGAFLWALSRENDGSFVGMSRP